MKNIFWRNQIGRTLTQEMFDEALNKSIICKGIGYIQHPWFKDAKSVSEGGNLESDGRSVKVKYVVYKGGGHDWCIYHSLDANITRSRHLQSSEHLKVSYGIVLKAGQKLYSDRQIKALVNCTDKLFEKYRY